MQITEVNSKKSLFLAFTTLILHSFAPVGAHRLEVPVLARVPLGACRLEAPILTRDLIHEPVDSLVMVNPCQFLQKYTDLQESSWTFG